MLRSLRSITLIASSICICSQPGLGQAPELSDLTRQFVAHDDPVIALTGVRVIDGTGGAMLSNRTIVVRGGRIAEMGADGTVSIPDDARVLDLAGKTILPGFVQLHEHMFYPVGQLAYNQQDFSFPRLYLAGGATTIRTGGSISPYGDLNLRRDIDAGLIPGPRIHVTGPYLNGPGLPIRFVKSLRGPDDARRMVAYWTDEGVTSFKAYMHISRAELAAAIQEVHTRGLKITGHLCSVTYREAAELGIDNLEHGFMAATDFVTDKEPDRCPSGGRASLLALDPHGPEATSLIRHLADKGVAITSTLTVFETSVPGQPRAPNTVLDAMAPQTRDIYLRRWGAIASNPNPQSRELFQRAMALERAFFEAGGLLVVGTDPTGYGGVVAGFANQRAIELLVDAGLTPEQAIMVSTQNGARYLQIEDELGTVDVGKVADLVVIEGDPSADITDIRNVEMVFKDGIAYDSERLIESVKGSVGLR
jgi:enamidase